MNIAFLIGYFHDVSWQLIANTEQEVGTRLAAYLKLIEYINAKDVDALDKCTDTKGEALYVAAGICGEQFWSALKDQIRVCLDIDVADGDLSASDAEALLKTLS